MLGAIAVSVLLAVPATERARDETEALCNLQGLFTAERSYFQEKDRYERSLQQIGFVPLPCADGSRAFAGDTVASSCRFHYRVRVATDVSFEAEATGAGRTFTVGVDGLVREGDKTLERRDCGDYLQAGDPLLSFHQARSETDCRVTETPGPCGDPIRLARAGVGAAQWEASLAMSDGLPLTRDELIPTRLAPLCREHAADRKRAALELSRRGTLLEAVLWPSCAPAGIAAGLSLLLRQLDSICPGPSCVPLLERARENGSVLQPESLALAVAQAVDWGPDRFERALGLTRAESEWLSRLVVGEPATIERPLVPAWTRAALAEAPPSSTARWLLAAELGGGASAGEAFDLWAATADCWELRVSPRLARGDARRAGVLARTQARCSDAGAALAEVIGTLTAADLPEVLDPLDTETLARLLPRLRLADPAWARVLVPWLVRRDPDLLRWTVISPEILEVLLQPDVAALVGGNEGAIDLLLGDHPPRLTPSVEAEVHARAIALARTPERVFRLAPRLTAEERVRFEANIRGDPKLSAALAASDAFRRASRVDPSSAGRCLEELEAARGCVLQAEAALSPTPPGQLRSSFFGSCGNDAPPPEPIDGYCRARPEAIAARCGALCGGPFPTAETLERLEAAAGQRFKPTPGLTACTPVAVEQLLIRVPVQPQRTRQ